MKAEMDQNGLITIKPENGAEAFALKAWSESASVNVEDFKRCESAYFRSSKLLIDANFPWSEE